MKADWSVLLPLLVHIQANLDRDLSLAALSRVAGLSQFRLHRLFKATIGETLKAYTLRLRLERAAFRLLVHGSTGLRIAMECGFQNQETFIRAFRRRFGCSPREYRVAIPSRSPATAQQDRTRVPETVRTHALSATRVIHMRPMHLAYKRHVGPYESVPDSLFAELSRWARRRQIPGPRIWLGLGHDAPITTKPEQLRFDAALAVPEPFAAEDGVGYQLLPGGPFAVTTHAGPYATLPEAYATIFPRVTTLPGYRLIGLPAVEIYHTANVNSQHQLNHTDLCLPVVQKHRSS
jgi:AraC family transcriptional regulator